MAPVPQRALLDDTPAAPDRHGGRVTEHLVFRIRDMLLALPVSSVREILDVRRITPLPQAPPETLGFIDLDGVSPAVVDLGQTLGQGAAEPGEESRFVVLELGAGPQPDVVVILVDAVEAVTDLDEGQDRPVPSVGLAARQAFVAGLGRHGGRTVLILDAERLFATRRAA